MDNQDTYPTDYGLSQPLPDDELHLLFEHMISPFSYYKMIYDEQSNPVDYVFLAVNSAFEAESQIKREDIIGRSVLSVYPQTEHYWIEAFGRVAKTGVAEHFSNFSRALNSWYEVIAYSPKPDHVAITLNNTTEAVKKRVLLLEKTLELNRQQDENYRLAHEEPVTKLPNRTSFLDAFNQWAIHYHTNNEPFAMVILSLDNYTEINASYGSVLGDRMLLIVADRLKAAVTGEELLFSLTGSKFSLLLRPAKQPDYVAARVNAYMEAMGKPLEIDGNYFRLTASCGIVFYPQHGVIEDDLLMKANLALYRVRGDGGDAFMFYSQSLGQSLLNRTKIRFFLRKAIDNQEFELHYQPQVDSRTGRVTGFEALLRWHSPELGEVAPLSFIPIAEENRLIIPLGDWVLQNACQVLRRVNAHFHAQFRMAVNISGIQLMQAGFVEHVMDVVQSAEIPNGLLELEITESIFLNRDHSAADVLNELHDQGFRVALDDFGTGYSSLNLLHKLKLDTVKIDRSFIAMSDNAALTELIVRLGHSLNTEIVAEGVETETQRGNVVATGCDKMQGFLFSPALREAELMQYLEWKRQQYDGA